MNQAIQDITQKLVTHYQPDRIILFGSGVSGQVRKDSDLDLFIIKETARSPLERRMEVERILADRDRPLDIFVYTSGEVRSLWALGSPFIMEVMEKGKNPGKIHDIVDLLNRARKLGWAISFETDEGLLPMGEPRLEDAQKAYEGAGKLLGMVRNLLDPKGTKLWPLTLIE